MSLKLSNRVTKAQRELLIRLDYVGKWNITMEEAAELITELIIQRRGEEDNQDIGWDIDPADQESY